MPIPEIVEPSRAGGGLDCKVYYRRDLKRKGSCKQSGVCVCVCETHTHVNVSTQGPWEMITVLSVCTDPVFTVATSCERRQLVAVSP